MLRLVCLFLLGFSVAAQAADQKLWPVGSLPLAATPVSLEPTSKGPLLRLSDGSAWHVEMAGDTSALKAAVVTAPETAPDLIPDGKVVRGSGTIRRAWLAEPTTEYGHAILGDGIEAAALKVETADGALLSFSAPAGTVFEDLTPRLWDLDQDGDAEAWVIRSGPEEGGRLEAYSVQDGALRLRYATDPIGLGHRWLNLVGVADFTGDGQREVALVRTPHIGGVLIIYRPAGIYLDRIGGVPGFSNHAIGSRQLGLSWVGDIDKDGAADILLPGQSRREIEAFSLANGGFRILGATERTGHIETSFVEMPLSNGARAILFADDKPSLRWLLLPE